MGKQRPATADTVYPIASCTKAFTSATCAILAHDGLLSWDEPVSSYLPQFRTVHSEEVGQRTTLVDICSHATGLASLDRVAFGFHGEAYNSTADQVAISSHLPVLGGFRSRWSYNNSMYGVAGEVIRAVCGESAGTVMRDRIFAPLGLRRTGTSNAERPADGDIARGYAVMENGSLLLVDNPRLEDGAPQGAAGFIQSTVNDMLCWARAVMDSEARQSVDSRRSGFSEGQDPLPGIAFTRSAHQPITSDHSTGENSYGLGWFRHTIPSRWLGSISPNFMLLQDPPIIGETSRPRLAIVHYGAFEGFLSSFYTFPETCSAIIVLANSSASHGDPTDLIAQALCQELFDMTPRVELQVYARRAIETSRQIWPSLVRTWVLTRATGGSLVPPVADYVGLYKNAGFQLEIEICDLRRQTKIACRQVRRNANLMYFAVNGLISQRAKLRHYHNDDWSFLPDSRDDAIRKGMEHYMSLPSVLLSFVREVSGRVSAVEWDLDAGMSGVRRISPIRFEKIS